MDKMTFHDFITRLPKSVMATKKIVPYSGPVPEGDPQDYEVIIDLGFTELKIGPLSAEDAEHII
ncbi:MAG: hypothetical protein KDE30_13195 [Novosphingobium sp.]|nr:hypothetical protein [Novosphingobium sp.]